MLTWGIIEGAAVAVCLALYFAFDRRRYHGRRSAAMQPTNEVFRDPASGQLMRVWTDATTGHREYRPGINPDSQNEPIARPS